MIEFKRYIPEAEREATEGRKEFQERMTRAVYKKCGEKDGPLIVVPEGALYVTTDLSEIVEDFLENRAEPVLPPIPAEAEFLVLRSFKAIFGGEYKLLHMADVVLLTRAEAIPLIKGKLVRAIDPEVFKI